jgi:TonB-linked SusC/RagA family outer membrane protein
MKFIHLFRCNIPLVASKQLWRTMRIFMVIMTAFLMQVSASTNAQQLTIKDSHISLREVFLQIRKQTGYTVLAKSGVIAKIKPISLNITAMPLEDALKKILTARNLEFTIKDKAIFISRMEKSIISKVIDYFVNIDVNGRVAGENGEPIAGATVKIKGTNISASTDAEGRFLLRDVTDNSILEINYIGYKSQEVVVLNKITRINITLVPEISKLDEVSVEGYRKGSQRLATSNISKISGEELAKQPVSNPFQALEGRIPGMVVSQTTGVPGARVKMQIRGRANIDANITSDQPLFVIDGVPVAANNDKVNSLSGPFGPITGEGLSAFAGLNAADIESIDVLKDADATAIYGSRGANGVVLITTKKGKPGKMRTIASIATGISNVSVLPKMLNTQQYIEMRNEAFKNDNIGKTNTNAYDLLLWDQNRYTDFADLLVGNSAPTTDAQLSFSGGSKQTQYRIGAGYHKEGTVWPGAKSMDRLSANFNMRSTSDNERFSIEFSGLYSLNSSDLTAGDLASSILLPPNYKLYNDDGSLSWSEGGYSAANSKGNPLAFLNQKYLSKMINLNASANVQYKITPALTIRSTFGYNSTQNDDRRISPISAQNPLQSASLTGQSAFGNTVYKNWIIEPQLEYNRNIGKGKFNALLGATFNRRNTNFLTTTGSNYTSDDLLGSLTGATLTATNGLTQYHYQAFFGRLNYNWQDRYIVNLTGRRDGSSRFGPEHRFSNFGAAGAAWLFGNEDFVKNLAVLSYGKLRASYGITGNDQISETAYQDTWITGATYGDLSTLAPNKHFSTDLHWEQNAKFELGLELGFLMDRILFTASAYKNISSDPLVNYPLSKVTGFASVTNNLNGVKVENKGLELTISSKNIVGDGNNSFIWSTDFNITLPKNKLKVYPDLANSSYGSTYTIGESLNRRITASFISVDPTSGLYKIQDVDGNNIVSTPDLIGGVETDPKYYGGLNNSFNYRRFNLSFFLQFTKQLGRSWKSNNLYNAPGMIFNVPVEAMERWQTVGQEATVQRYSTTSGPLLGATGYYAYMFSDAQYTDASYLRLKNLYLSYDIPANWLSALHIGSCKIYMQAQNLFVITGYKAGDPETQDYTRMAPLRTITGGLQLSF